VCNITPRKPVTPDDKILSDYQYWSDYHNLGTNKASFQGLIAKYLLKTYESTITSNFNPFVEKQDQ